MSVPDVLVLTYHGLAEHAPGRLEVTVEALVRQLRGLRRRGYRPATFLHAVTASDSRSRFAVTFDDACGQVLELAVPALRGLGIPGTVFVPVGYVDDGRALTWEELRALGSEGWEIGSHGLTHRPLVALSDTDLARELGASRARLEDMLQRPCLSLAYPFGLADDRVVRAAADAGYRAAATVAGDLHSPTPLLVPRVGVCRIDGPLWFRLKTSPLVRRMRGERVARPAVGAVRLLRRAQDDVWQA